MSEHDVTTKAVSRECGSSTQERSAPKNRFMLLMTLVVFTMAAVLWFSGNSTAPLQGAAAVRAPAPEPAATVVRRALVIGIGEYQRKSADNWSNLKFASSNATYLADALAREHGFHVETLLNKRATKSAIIAALDNMLSSGKDSADLVCFIGHRFDDGEKGDFWIPADAEKNKKDQRVRIGWIHDTTLHALFHAASSRQCRVVEQCGESAEEVNGLLAAVENMFRGTHGVGGSNYVVRFAGSAESGPRTLGAGREVRESGDLDTLAQQRMALDVVELADAGAYRTAVRLALTLVEERYAISAGRLAAEYAARVAPLGTEGLAGLRDSLGRGHPPMPQDNATKPSLQLACLGPVVPFGSAPSVIARAQLYRLLLQAEFEAWGHFKVLNLDTVLDMLRDEKRVVGDLGHPQARQALHEMLPDSLLLCGDLLQTDDGDKLFMQLMRSVDIAPIFLRTSCRDGEVLEGSCSELAAQVVGRLRVLGIYPPKP